MIITLRSMLLLVFAALFFSFHLPADWIKGGTTPEKYAMGIDPGIMHDGHDVMTIISINKHIKGHGALVQKIAAGEYAGKRIRMTGYLKSKEVNGWSGLSLRIDQANSKRPLAVDNMQDRAIRGTAGWSKYELVLDVPDKASNISFGAFLSGEGQIWFDANIELEIVGNDIPITGVNNSIHTVAELKTVTQAMLDSTRPLTKGDKKLNAAYLSLFYDFNNIDSVEWVYTEAKVPRGEAPLHTYYAALEGVQYYAGIQTNSEKERRIIFSTWDLKGGGRKDVPDSAKAVLLAAGKDVIHHRFNSEGSGIHTHYVFDWKEDSTYKFLIHSLPDPVGRSTAYTCFVQIGNDWKMIAKIKVPGIVSYSKFASSFLENFRSMGDEYRRSVSYQNTWVRTASGEWKEITDAVCRLPFENKKVHGNKMRQLKDYGCGLSESYGFMLSSGGGFTGTYIPLPASIKRNAKGIVPLTVMPE